MKLAEALMLRADLQKKLASLRERIGKYAKVQKGDKPAEDPHKLLMEAHGVVEQTENLVAAINRANLRCKLKDGRTLTDAIAHRDGLAQRHSLLLHAVAAATATPELYSVREVKWVSVLEIPKLQKQADDAAKKLRETNAAIQEANWQAEIEE